MPRLVSRAGALPFPKLFVSEIKIALRDTRSISDTAFDGTGM